MNSMPSGAYSSQQAAAGKEKIPSGYKKFSVQQFTPEQIQLFRSLFSHLSPDSELAGLAEGDEEAFNELERPALKQFNQLQGNIASRFSGMGLGGQKNSGFQNTLNSAAQDFAGQLQSQRNDLKRQALNDLMGLSSNLLQQKPFENGLVQKPKSFLHEFGSSFGGGIGQGLGQAAGAAAAG